MNMRLAREGPIEGTGIRRMRSPNVGPEKDKVKGELEVYVGTGGPRADRTRDRDIIMIRHHQRFVCI